MSSERFFIIKGKHSEGETVELIGDESIHLFKVMRARPGEEVSLLDGSGGTYRAVIRSASAVEITEVSRTGPPPPVDMAIPLLKAGRMEFAVEKCAELGIRRIIPFRCERSIWRGTDRDADRKSARLEKKAAAACKQSGNPWFTEIAPVVSFTELVGRLGAYSTIFLADSGGKPFAWTFERPVAESGAIGIVGPEGGLSPSEMKALASSGAVKVALGPNRLRSETSAVLLASGMLLSGADGR
jgi:16S rRNA (uracil1498-N3)-methyltransferase